MADGTAVFTRLSEQQKTLWLQESAAEPDTPVAQDSVAFAINGTVDLPGLRECLRRLTVRHVALRTSFVETRDGLETFVRQDIPDVVDVVDLRDSPAGEAPARTDELVVASQRRRFDLATGALLRALVVLRPGSQTLVCLTVHNLAADSRSLELLVDDLQRTYVSLINGETPVEPPAPDRPAARTIGDGTKIAVLQEMLRDVPELVRLPLDRARPPVPSFSGAARTFAVPAEQLSGLRTAVERPPWTNWGDTDAVALMASFAVLLCRSSGHTSVAVGTDIDNRSDRTRDAVGCFAEPTVLPLTIQRDMTFRALCAQIVELLDDPVPFADVLPGLNVRRDPSFHPVFQTMFTYRRAVPAGGFGPGTTTERLDVTRTATPVDLRLTVRADGGEIECDIEYNPTLFETGTIERMARHYRHLVDAFAANPDAIVSRVPLLPAAERSLILDVWNDTDVELPASTVIDTIEAQVRGTPEAVAVIEDDRTLTYDELDRQANQVANAILARWTAGDPPFVGIYLPRSIEMTVAQLGVMKAGFAYLPLDPDQPVERTSFMLSDSQVPLVVTDTRLRTDLTLADDRVLVPPRDGLDTNPPRQLVPDSPAYVIYTSGSTGHPKGVVNRHVSLFNRLTWMRSEFGLRADDRVLRKSPNTFDVSVYETFWPLMSGAAQVIAMSGGHLDTDYLKHLIREHRVTTASFVPSVLKFLLSEPDLGEFCGSLRRVIASGEALSPQTVRDFHTKLSCELHNVYGPAEAAIGVTHWRSEPARPVSIVPIGRPIPNVRLYVVDGNGDLAAIGVPGEICIGGVAVALGYHNRDELTSRVFVPDRFDRRPGARMYRTGDLARWLPDGNLCYLGRIDSQVKLRGARVEPDEISAALRSLLNVRDAAVVARDVGGESTLVAYVVSTAFDKQAIKRDLQHRVPDFMIPAAIVDVPAIPVTANGKLDVKALPAPRTRRARSAPPTPEESALVEVWSTVLGTVPDDLDAHFTRFGAESIQAVAVTVRLRELGYVLTVRDVLAYPSIRRLAARLTRRLT
jgi:amino acid adenylation domain-containing protein